MELTILFAIFLVILVIKYSVIIYSSTLPTDIKSSVSIIMGSNSDWDTMKNAADTLIEFGIQPEVLVLSAHRTPDDLFEFASQAESRGVKVIIAGAGGAAHLPGMCASKTIIPVLGVPIETTALKGMDSLLSIVQMPAGVPVGTLAIGKAGAINAALFAVALMMKDDPVLREKYREYREELRRKTSQVG
jgi:5-(carboxyamino)imidazole ribonucleotide mutase